MKNSLIVITGPTASGKTDLAIQVAKKWNTEIISADSRQIFKGMEIGSAFPSPEQLSEVKHHFIGELELTEKFSAGDFAQEAQKRIKTLFNSHEKVVVVGGSGLYIKALLDGMDELPPVLDSIRNQLNEELHKNGLAVLTEELKNADPVYYEQVDKNNPQRIIRALEIYRTTGLPFSSFRSGKKESVFPYNLYAIDLPREELYQRINNRAELMMKQGFLEEVTRLKSFRTHNALNTVGYKELLDYLDGQMSLEQSIEKLKQHTRNFAKRQLTYIRHQLDAKWINPNTWELDT
ncbi:MAG: tRNA (adenosine(37)-N6)-dimethylallyltransferase MiaA [Bacteroidia bacterium]|nr:tRNA (adenosine(37)-N6)-dimethylallyltransferase MiaA [Bacteroidia bacterium]